MEKLEQLIKNRDDAYEAYHQNEIETKEAITNFLKSNCVPEGVESKIDLGFNTNSKNGRIKSLNKGLLTEHYRLSKEIRLWQIKH